MEDEDLDIGEAGMMRMRKLVPSHQASLDTLRFLCLIANGIGPNNAAAEVGWSPRVLTEKSKDPEFIEMMNDAEQCTREDIETAMIRRAKNGNVQAQALYLFNRAPDRWKPAQTRVAVTTVGRFQLEVVEATRQAAVGLIEGQDLRDLQIGGPLDAIEATAS